MFGDAIGPARLLLHDWRDDVKRIGELSAEEVDEIVGAPARAVAAVLHEPRACRRQLRPRRLDRAGRAARGGRVRRLHEARLHRARRPETIQRSHFFSAVHGIEHTMAGSTRRFGSCSTSASTASSSRVAASCSCSPLSRRARRTGPARRLLGEGGTRSTGGDAFREAVALSAEVNIETVELRSTGASPTSTRRSTARRGSANKAIYRTRLAMADGGELSSSHRASTRFGEDPVVDVLIRRHGYRGREAALAGDGRDPELAANLAAVAHLIHGSTEGRFNVTYAPGPELSRAEIEGVGFRYLPLEEALERFLPDDDRHPEPGARAMADLKADRYIEGGGARARSLSRRRRAADRQSARTHRHPALRRSRRRGSSRPAGSSSRATTTSCGCSTRRACRSSRRAAGRVDDRAVWQLLADNVDLFALTPTGLWLRETLATVFGIHDASTRPPPMRSTTRSRSSSRRRSSPRAALLDRFGVECLATTDPAGAPLDDHRGLAPAASGRRSAPTRSSRSTPPAGARR